MIHLFLQDAHTNLYLNQPNPESDWVRAGEGALYALDIDNRVNPITLSRHHPTSLEGLRRLFKRFGYHGLVWIHPDGRRVVLEVEALGLPYVF